MTRKILFIGYGYTAQALRRRLEPEGWRLAGTARTAEKAEALAASGVTPILWTAAGLDPAALDGVDALLVSTPPGADGCPAFAALKASLPARARDIGWTGYLSSNAVYGDRNGAWVDETSDLRPSSERGLARVAAEAEWAGFAVEWSMPFAVFRLPGIYGPGRSALDAVREGRAQRVYKAGQVFNRMHVDDIAATLAASIASPLAGDLYNLADDEPAPPQDVIAYACRLLSIPSPPLTPLEDANLSEMGRSFYAENKRVSNARIKSVLGVKLAHPTYREGLDAIHRVERDAQASS